MQPPEQSSTLLRVGQACALALFASAICALPTALRAQYAGGGLVDSFVVAMAVLLALFLPVTLLFPRALRGWRGAVGQHAPRPLVMGIAVWAALSVGVLALLAATLKANTNHRGLGGATFGVTGAGVAGVCAMVVGRFVGLAEGWRDRAWARWLALGGLGALSLLPLVTVLVPVLRSDVGDHAAAARAAVFDLLAMLAVSALVLPRTAPAQLAGAIRIGAAPLALCLVVIGLVRIETSDAANPVKRGGGAVAAVLSALEGWSDRDGDGEGAHFGGHDCDEGDPRRHPRLPDLGGDGIDADCDGIDGARSSASAPPPPPQPVASAQPPASGSASTVAAKAPPPSDKPDLILVTLDTVRADRCTPYGYEKATTPSLAALAERALLFQYAYAPGSSTQRAIVPLVSGLSYSDTPHTNKEWPRLLDETTTVAERLQAAGYATGAVSSFTWIRGDRGFGQGFGELDESAWSERHPERESTGDLAYAAAARLYGKLAGGDAPLFLWVHLFDAHSNFVDHPGSDFGKGAGALYDGEIAYTDAQLGKLVELVGKSGREGRTVWIVHGSQGEAFGEHGQNGHGTQLYDESIRVPLLIAAPGKRPGKLTDRAVSTMDIVPTVLDYAGVEATGLQGVSLRPAVDGAKLEHAPVLSHAERRLAIIDLPWKLLVFRRREAKDRLFLFDLSADPGETKDVAADHADVVQRLAAISEKAR
jgi:choline-sulfatase